MALELDYLDSTTRPFMLSEVEKDIANKNLHLSPRLTSVGFVEYPPLLRSAVSKYDDDWLAQKIQENGLLVFQENVHREGKSFTKKVPVDAHLTLAQGEFNRFYMRGLCLRAIDEGIESVTVIRAKTVTSPRRESEAKIGNEYDPHALLDDLRTHIGVDTALGLPPGPNSGLSITLG